MDAKFASTNSFLFLFLSFQSSSANQSEAFLPWGLSDKTNLQIVPKNGLLYVPVNYKFTSACQLNCIYKLILQSVVVLF
jgi:hypothetical protein